MLIQFTVENFRSFRAETALSMVATDDKHHPGHVVPTAAGSRIPPLLRAAAIYGANASGKSNLVKALLFARHLVTAGTQADATTGLERFAMDRGWAAKPARFGFLIAWQAQVYSYAFELTPDRIVRETLAVTVHKKEQPLFERETRPDGKAAVRLFHALARRGTKEFQHLEFVAMGTRANQLFLREMAERNVDAAKPLLQWFHEVLNVIKPNAQYDQVVFHALNDQSFCAFLKKVLQLADTGVSGISTEKVETDVDRLVPGIPAEAREHLLAQLAKGFTVQIATGNSRSFLTASGPGQPPAILKLRTRHECLGGGEVQFDFDQESDGTRRLAYLAPAFFDALKRPAVYVVDELDRSLHPHLTRMLVQLFLTETPAHTGSQVLFTTHDTGLLDQDLLRRDEVWFVEKDRAQASRLYSLAEFKPRPDLRLEKGYLQGRFGAVPFVGDLRQLGLGEEPAAESTEVVAQPATTGGRK